MHIDSHLKKIAQSLSGLALLFIWSCSDSPVESESLSSEAHSEKKSLRISAFGVLTPSDKKQKVMIEDARNNVLDYFSNNNFMDFSGTITDKNRTVILDRSGFVIADPFQMPQIYGAQLDIDQAIRAAQIEAADTEDYSMVEYLEELRAAVTLGLTRYVRWLTTESMAVEEGGNYSFELKLIDRSYPDIEIMIRESTVVPGGFEITYPDSGAVLEPSDFMRLQWTASANAAGYRIIATSPLNPYKKFEAAVRHNSFTVPQFFQEKAPYKIQIWALDTNYFEFLTQRLEQQRVDRTHFFDYGEMNVSALAVFGSRVIRTTAFSVE